MNVTERVVDAVLVGDLVGVKVGVPASRLGAKIKNKPIEASNVFMLVSMALSCNKSYR